MENGHGNENGYEREHKKTEQAEQTKGKVYFLLDEGQRRAAARYVQGEIAKVDADIQWVEQGLSAVEEAARAMDEILALLGRMREISVLAAERPDAVTAPLRREFENLRAQIDAIASGERATWSQSELRRVRGLAAAVDSLEL